MKDNDFTFKTGMYVSWKEDGLTATALVENKQGFFGEAINCYRDSQMGEKDKDGYYDRIWYGDHVTNCECEIDTIRPATRVEVVKFITMCREMKDWDAALDDLFYDRYHNAWYSKKALPFRPRGCTTSISITKPIEKFNAIKEEKPSLEVMQHELFSDEEYAKKEFECHGYKFHPKPFVCNRCGAANYAHFVWVEGNRSIQERCSCCDSYITCVKYDPRDKGDKISDPFYKP